MMSLIMLSTLKNPVEKSYIDTVLGRDGAFDENQEIVRGEVIVLKEDFEKNLHGNFWIYNTLQESFEKQSF